jgi:hypothetical protein
VVGGRLGLDDLAGVAVVGGDDDQGVGVALGVGQPDGDGAVEGDRLADLAAGVLGVVLLVDGGPLDLEEEAVAAALGLGLEQRDRLAGHVGQAGLARRPLALEAALRPAAEVGPGEHGEEREPTPCRRRKRTRTWDTATSGDAHGASGRTPAP